MWYDWYCGRAWLRLDSKILLSNRGKSCFSGLYYVRYYSCKFFFLCICWEDNFHKLVLLFQALFRHLLIFDWQVLPLNLASFVDTSSLICLIDVYIFCVFRINIKCSRDLFWDITFRFSCIWLNFFRRFLFCIVKYSLQF